MKIYLLALGAGILVGVIYGGLGVKSPAPPLVALVGLLGILIGEQSFAIARRATRGEAITLGWLARECAPQLTGVPHGATAAKPTTDAPAPPRARP